MKYDSWKTWNEPMVHSMSSMNHISSICSRPWDYGMNTPGFAEDDLPGMFVWEGFLFSESERVEDWEGCPLQKRSGVFFLFFLNRHTDIYIYSIYVYIYIYYILYIILYIYQLYDHIFSPSKNQHYPPINKSNMKTSRYQPLQVQY